MCCPLVFLMTLMPVLTHIPVGVVFCAETSLYQQASNSGAATPEEAVSGFLAAMAAADLEQLKQFAMPDEDLAILVDGKKHEADPGKELRQMKLSRLKIGDVVTIPVSGGTAEVTMDETRVNESRQQLVLPQNPIPFDVVRKDGSWRVNAKPLIAARKASKRSADIPDWTLTGELPKSLAAEFEAATFKFNPPSEFRYLEKSMKTDDTSSMYVWAGQVRKDGSYGVLGVTVSNLSADESNNYTLVTASDEIVTGMCKGHEDSSHGETQFATIHGMKFAITEYSGIGLANRRPGIAGRQVHGVVSVAMFGHKIIMIQCQDVAPDHEKTLELGRLAIKTFQVLGKK